MKFDINLNYPIVSLNIFDQTSVAQRVTPVHYYVNILLL